MTLAQWQRKFPQSRVPFELALDVVRALGDLFHRAHVDRADHSDIAASAIHVQAEDGGMLLVRLDGAAAQAATEGVFGARRYQAPERWLGRHQDTYSDQYALATLFVELVTGEHPFADVFATEDVEVVRSAVCNRPPRLPDDCPRREVLLRALAKNPHRRFPSCGVFLLALVDPRAAQRMENGEHGASGHMAAGGRAHGHGGGKPAGRPAKSAPRRRLPPVVRALMVPLALLAAGAAVFWAFDSGWISQFLRADDRETRRETARQAELAELAENEAKLAGKLAAEAAPPPRLAAIEEEIRQQRAAAAKALKDLQDFLSKGGGALLEVRAEELRKELRRIQSERSDLEARVAARRRLADAVTQLRMRAVPFESVSAAIPSDCEAARAYAALSAAAAQLDALTARFTERHPEVVRQRKLAESARAAYLESLVSTLRRAQTEQEEAAKAIGDLRGQEERLSADLQKAEREGQLARLRQDELEKARARASQRLADLLQMETRVRFGGQTSPGDDRTSAAR